jgi:hypothetical protein
MKESYNVVMKLHEFQMVFKIQIETSIDEKFYLTFTSFVEEWINFKC